MWQVGDYASADFHRYYVRIVNIYEVYGPGHLAACGSATVQSSVYSDKWFGIPLTDLKPLAHEDNLMVAGNNVYEMENGRSD